MDTFIEGSKESEWTPVKGYEGLYSINKKGEVLSRYGKILKQYLSSHKFGYKTIKLCDTRNKKIRQITIHRLMAEIFLDNPLNLPQVDHIDRNKFNNNLENLRWVNRVTQRGNCGGWKNKPSNLPKSIFNHKNKKYDYYWIRITKEGKYHDKMFSKNNYDLDYVVKYRNKMYEELDLPIVD